MTTIETERTHELASGRIVTVEAEQTRNGVHIMRGIYCTQKHAKCIAGQCGHQKTRVYLTEGNPNTDSLEMTSVTTFLNVIAKPQLIPWALGLAAQQTGDYIWEQVLAEVEITPQLLQEAIAHGKKQPDAVRDEAADWGTQAHGVIDSIIKFNMEHPDSTQPIPEGFLPTVAAFLDFTAEYGLTYLHSEIMLYHRYGVAGSADFIAKDREGRLWVGDHKTGARIYAEAALQGAAYAYMYEAETGEEIAEVAIVRYEKDEPAEGESGFEVKFVKDWRERFEVFFNAMELQKGLKQSPWKD